MSNTIETSLEITTPIDAVLFDYGLVLSGPPNAKAWARMRTITGLDEESLHREYWAHRHEYDRGTHIAYAYWELVAAGNGLTFTPEQIADLVATDTDLWTDLNYPMVEWARALQQAGIRTGILSNLGDAMAAGLLKKFDWLSGFYHCTWSHALQIAKPERAIYQHATEGLATAPDRILFVDDRADNIAAAQEFGMKTIQYRDHAQFADEMYARGFGPLLHPRPHDPAHDALDKTKAL
ncbi:HAD family hydrolase [Granulicella arctica]|uniref:HAD family hydrolase n=1 Tax=Granulicella arctica TaxID=940613 RepID=UPI0021E0DF4C|nr:HAD family phosphatase [Granulicella arctica]